MFVLSFDPLLCINTVGINVNHFSSKQVICI
jgi:hypothetical protein